jgi:hypothetical protein
MYLNKRCDLPQNDVGVQAALEALEHRSSQSNGNQDNEDRTVPLVGHFTFRRSSALDLLLRFQRKRPAATCGRAVLLN